MPDVGAEAGRDSVGWKLQEARAFQAELHLNLGQTEQHTANLYYFSELKT